MRRFFPSVLLIIFGFVIYFNVLNSPFYMDDYGQVVINPDIKNLSSIPSFYFKTSVHLGGNQLIIADFYRPIFFSAYTLLFVLGNGLSFFFHLFQVGIFSINAVLVFLFFAKFFKRKLAFLLALLFLVHPANEEAAQYAAALSEPLFFCFGMIALLLVSSVKIKNLSTIFVYFLMILGSLLSKETGVLFLIITLVYILFFQSHYIKKYLLAATFAGFAYFVLRFIATRNTVSILIQQHVLSAGERAILVPKVIYTYIELITATTLSLPNSAYLKNNDIKTAILPFLAVLIVLISLIAVGFWIRRYFKSSFKIYAFFFIWVTLGLGIHSQIIPLEVLIASRWMYFPVVGALGMLGVVVTILQPYFFKYRVLFLVLFFIYLGVCIIMTLILNIHRASFSGYMDQTMGTVKLF